MAICLKVINLTCRTAHSEYDWLVFGGFFNCTDLAKKGWKCRLNV